MVHKAINTAVSPLQTSPQELMRSFAEPHGKLYLLSGGEVIFRLSLKMAAFILHGNGTLAVVDGANHFNVHAIARYAQFWKRSPDDFLQRIFVSRGFTCYQMEAAITDRLPKFLKKANSRTAMIFGLLDTLYDEQVRFREARQIIERTIAVCQSMRSEGIALLIACSDVKVFPAERNQFLPLLKKSADRAYRIGEMNGKLHIVHENKSYLSA